MRDEDRRVFHEFLSDLNRETDRGLALVSAALIDEKLGRTLLAFFCEGKSANRLVSEPNGPLGTFSARTEACMALGLIDLAEYREILLVRKIRNLFAHAHKSLAFASAEVSGLCTSLATPLPPDIHPSCDTPRMRFSNAVLSLTSALYYRPEWVMKERRAAKVWAEPVRWRSVKDEPPPDGAFVIGANFGPLSPG